MGNMSYCRFNNTAGDLNDCLFALTGENEYEISEEEVQKGISMFTEFLEFCVENNIIGDYQEDKIEELFANHNKLTKYEEK